MQINLFTFALLLNNIKFLFYYIKGHKESNRDIFSIYKTLGSPLLKHSLILFIIFLKNSLNGLKM
jgi:hypothetical protein